MYNCRIILESPNIFKKILYSHFPLLIIVLFFFYYYSDSMFMRLLEAKKIHQYIVLNVSYLSQAHLNYLL